MRRTILTLAAVLAATAAHAQSSSPWPQSGNVLDPEGVPLYQRNPVVVDPEAGLPVYKRKFMPPQESLDWLPAGARIVATIKPPPLPTPPPLEPVVMDGGKGGNIMEHQTRFWTLKQQGATVKMYAGCWSACTLITAYIPKERLCFAEGAFMAFHSAQSADRQPKLDATLAMYSLYPAEIQQWIDRNGGPYKMTVETYWTLYAPELWAMGYPRCKP